ncbi:CoA transferase [Bacteriovoracaceae bacterium]|nr:CoA transferase [Bacteriovoracaceae bacterium]MDC1174867.1 CoA transferase [Bacteriovoracaceae bacterium]
MLSSLTVLDFSHRLPGPYATYLLAGLGAKVIKVEDVKFQDPFLSGAFKEMDESFITWYHQLNDNKGIKRFDFNSSKIKEQLNALIQRADVIMMGLPEKLADKVGVSEELLNKRPIVYCRPLSSKKNNKPAHDLNSLAETGLLEMHVHQHNESDTIEPPMLPFSGISFGSQMALQILSAHINVLKTNKFYPIDVYLDESTKTTLGPFYAQELKEKNINRFLHNGKFPCYCIYKSKDNKYVALAAVEEKFWINFCELFNIDMPAEKRFQYSDRTIFNQLSTLFKELDSKDILEHSQKKDCCLSIF